MRGEKIARSNYSLKQISDNWPEMKWVGPEYWGKRLQDGDLKNGMAICNITAENRTLQLLTVQKRL